MESPSGKFETRCWTPAGIGPSVWEFGSLKSAQGNFNSSMETLVEGTRVELVDPSGKVLAEGVSTGWKDMKTMKNGNK